MQPLAMIQDSLDKPSKPIKKHRRLKTLLNTTKPQKLIIFYKLGAMLAAVRGQFVDFSSGFVGALIAPPGFWMVTSLENWRSILHGQLLVVRDPPHALFVC